MVFCDKATTSEGTLIGRPLIPVASCIGTVKDGEDGKKKLNSLTIEKESIGTPADDIEWIRLGSLRTPTLRHCTELTEWVRSPPVRSNHTTRTGPGGSSLCLTKMTIGDAVKAANRFKRDTRTNHPSPSSTPQPVGYKWTDGTIESFRKRLPIGISGEFIGEDDVCKWQLEGGAYVSFDEKFSNMNIFSTDIEETKFLCRMVERRFPQIEFIAQAPTKDKVPERVPQVTKQRSFKLLKNFVAEEPGELTVDEGEEVVFLSADASGWTAVRHAKTGKIGYVPATYIREINS
jgi:hypothetical protein